MDGETMKRLIASAGVLLIGSLAACTTVTSGAGTASTPNGQVRATMSWVSQGGRNGTMTAQINNGESYQGQYFQITHDTHATDLGPLWAGWGGPWGGRRWGGWGGWGGWGYWGPNDTFVTTYSGRVVANLEGPNGTHMRCRFDLMRPSSGMAGGGQGSCQMPSGQVIDATFPPASA